MGTKAGNVRLRNMKRIKRTFVDSEHLANLNELKQAILQQRWVYVSEICQAYPELLNLSDEFVITPLHEAILNGAPEEVVLSMVKHSTKEVLGQQIQNDGSTVLHHLAWHGYTLAMELAISLISDDPVDVQTKDGQTPLHWCLCNEELTFDDHKQMSLLLLEHGSSVDLKDIFGDIPIDCYINNKCKKYGEDVKVKKQAELLKILSGYSKTNSCMKKKLATRHSEGDFGASTFLPKIQRMDNSGVKDFFIVSDDYEWEKSVLKVLKQKRPDINCKSLTSAIPSKTLNFIGEIDLCKKVVVGFMSPAVTNTSESVFAILKKMLNEKTIHQERLIPVKITKDAEVPDHLQSLTVLSFSDQHFYEKLLSTLDKQEFLNGISKAFRYEKYKGKTTIVSSRVLFFGKNGTERTSCVNCILGGKKETSLTNEFKTNADVYSILAQWKILGTEYKLEKQVIDACEVTQEIYENAIAENISEKIYANRQTTPDQSTSNECMSLTSYQTDEKERFKSFEKKETPVQKKIPDSIYQKIVDKPKVGSTVDHLSGMTSLLCYGALFLNYATHQFYLKNRSTYNVAFSLLDKLDDVEKPFVTDHFEATNLQMILFCIRTVYEHGVLHGAEKLRLVNKKVNLPPILLVGTHKDKIGGNEAKKIVNRIHDEMKNKPYKMHVDHEVYAVDNTNPKDEGIVKLKKNTCNYLTDMAETVPICWIDFQSKIEASGRTRIQLPFVEIAKMAFECGVFETNLMSALYYLSDIGVIFFPKTNKKLKNRVIVNLLKMTDMITRITTADMQSPFKKNSWNKFDKRGILEEELLRHLWEPEIENDASNFDVALECMKMFGLIFEAEFHQDNRHFLVPSRNKMKTEDLEIKKDKNQTVSIYITPTDILPDALGNVLVVEFLNLMKAKSRDLENLDVYQNCNDFDLYDDHLVRIGEVGIGKERALKVEISHKIDENVSEPCASVCIEVLTYLRDKLKNVCCTMEDVGYELKVNCNACDSTGQPHLHKLKECLEKGFVTCGGKMVDTSRFKYLFTIDSKEFNFRGGTMRFNDIKLKIPRNAINQGEKVNVYLTAIANKEIDLKPRETLLSPIVFCGPPGTEFKKPCLLSFPHSIVDEESWEFTGLVNDKPGGEWKKIKNDSKDYYCYVKSGRCFIKLTHFTGFAFLGIALGKIVKPVHMKVFDNWHKHLQNTYEIFIETWGKNCYTPMDLNRGVWYTYALSSNDITIRVEDIQEGWTAKPETQFVHKRLVQERYTCQFYLEAEITTGTSNRPTAKICLVQNDVTVEPYVQIPLSGVTTRSQERLRQQQNMFENQIDRPDSNIELLYSNLGKEYVGKEYKWLRFLLYELLPISSLEDGDNALELFHELAEQGSISCTNISILSEIANLTKRASAKNFIKEYKNLTKCKDGTRLSQYRKLLFNTLRNVGQSELPILLCNYKLEKHSAKFKDIWDLVLFLEKEGYLDETQVKLKKFARNLNGKAKTILLGETELEDAEGTSGTYTNEEINRKRKGTTNEVTGKRRKAGHSSRISATSTQTNPKTKVEKKK